MVLLGLPAVVSTGIVAASALSALFVCVAMFRRKKWDPKGKHCFVTGGSSGTGLSLAILLAKKGAHVSIVARDESRLKKALEQMEAARQDETQIFRYYQFSLDSLQTSKRALEAACAPHGGQAPDTVFTCAGSSTPGFFVEQTEQTMMDGMRDAYWIQAWPALAATQKMVRDGVQGRIALVSSTLGYIAFVGYSGYAPAKHAIRGLAETLRSELMLYNIDVHCFFPSTILSPGYERENLTKPAITIKIEGDDSGLTPDQAALAILEGVQKKQHHFAEDLGTNIFRASTRGSVPLNNVVVDIVLNIIAWVAVPIWRRSVDKGIRSHSKEHEDYLRKKGFFEKD